MLLGSHVSMSGKKMLEAASMSAESYGANTFMIYTGAPQNTRRKKIEDLNIEAGKQHMEEHGISNIVVHAPYIINIANSEREGVFEHGVEFLQEEIIRTEHLGSKQIVLHPGSHVGTGADRGIQSIIEGLNEVLSSKQDVQIALETMAGKGSEVGRTFDELARIIDGVTNNDRLSVCFDTCHVHDGGYDIVNDFEGVIEEFDKTIGIDRIKVLHINDSKNERGAHKDRHENIGFGHIGFDALTRVINHPEFKDIPKILETPFVGPDKKNRNAPYKYEIEMIRNGSFIPELKEQINPDIKDSVQ